MGILFGWIILSFIIGIIGSNRKIGFLGALFISLIFSPLIGLIFTLISKTDAEEKYRKSVLETQRSQQESLKELVSYKPKKKISIADEIEKLERLKKNNSITEEEFISLKKRIISSVDDEDEDTVNTELDKKITNIDSGSNSSPISYNPFIKNDTSGFNSWSSTKTSIIGTVFFVSLAILLFIIINDNKENNTYGDEPSNYQQTDTIPTIASDIPDEVIEVKDIKLKNFTYEDIARYGIATSMYEPINIVKSKKKNDYYYVYYVRLSDSQYFDFKVKFEGNRVIYGEVNGRWQDTELDEKITFEEIGNKVNIMGAGETVQYKKGD